MQLHELKKALDHCRLSIYQAKLLLEKRETCFQGLLALKAEDKKDPSTIRVLREEVKNIDHAIDLLDEDAFENLENLQERLVTAIILKYPETEPEFQHLKKALQAEQEREMQLADLCKKMAPLFVIFQQGFRLKNRRYSWIALLFGKSRSGQIGRFISESLDLTKRLLHEIEDPRFLRFLETFKREGEKTWNHALYRSRFFEFYEELSSLMDHLEKEHEMVLQNKARHENALEAFINRYCG